ncbi:MAG: FmdE family protein [Infirmifilum sp.]
MVSEELLKKAEDFHGHICPYLVLGLRASEIAMQRLGLGKAHVSESIGEDILAIVEANNCFADGVQIATGCTFGNNSLIYLDIGKAAVTLVRRGVWKGVRVYVDYEKISKLYFKGEVDELWRKVVVRREGTEDDVRRLDKLFRDIGLSLANAPEDLFKVEEVTVSEIEPAPIFETVRCEVCGETMPASRAVEVDGKKLCLSCAGKANAVIGRGIVLNFPVPIHR